MATVFKSHTITFLCNCTSKLPMALSQLSDLSVRIIVCVLHTPGDCKANVPQFLYKHVNINFKNNQHPVDSISSSMSEALSTSATMSSAPTYSLKQIVKMNLTNLCMTIQY